MSENLHSILSALDFGRYLGWEYGQVARWPEGQLDHCLANGLFVPDEPSQRVACTECGNIVDVILITKASGETEACLLCGECCSPRVPLQHVSCWRLDLSQFLAGLCATVGIRSGWHELVRDRVWRLGKWHIAGASRNLYLARKLHRLDAFQVVEEAKFPSGSLVFVPTQLPRSELRIKSLPTLIRLVDVLSWEGSGLAIDKTHIEMQLAATAAEANDDVPTVRRRSSRLAVMESLKQELVEHLRSARDHALTTLRTTGTPQLLPRPTHELLARQLGVHRTTISRCLEDRSAPELASLWKLAADIDCVLGAN